MILVDTNVLVDVLEDDPAWADWSIGQLRGQAQAHDLVINPIIYAELSLTFEKYETLDGVLDEMRISMREMPRPALFLAGKAFALYRHSGGRKGSVLADFFIGAHAAVVRCAVLTRDPRRYAAYFPTISLIVPN